MAEGTNSSNFPVLQMVKDWWVILAFVGGLVFWYAQTSQTIEEFKGIATELSSEVQVINGKVNELKTEVRVLETKLEQK